ncbi:MAG: hypothetical protein HYY24_26365 [Verrucomicrobia bacterium]|nr:hypothetical protein [Verrucomicrobiota bacterium]
MRRATEVHSQEFDSRFLRLPPTVRQRITEAFTRGGLPAGTRRFKAAEVEATLELLYLWEREWHGPKLSGARWKEILKAVFKVEGSAA